ncbi:MAG: hypothetical protein IIC51_10215 [Planctomycetes bacterium]|nr:hypothetical protein [Planctomycetota bacterium]
MSDENKKKVVLGSTLALLLGAGSYWFLGSGGRDSDGLNASPPGKKVIRVVSTDEPMKQKGYRRQAHARNGPKVGKGRRDLRVRQSDGRKGTRPKENRSVKTRKTKPRPAA